MSDEAAYTVSNAKDPIMVKHVGLDSAIKSLNTVVNRARALKGRIIESQVSPEKLVSSKEEIVPSLAEILSQSPDRIRKYGSELHELLTEIEQLLF